MLVSRILVVFVLRIFTHFFFVFFYFFFLMIRRPPRSTLFPTRRSSDLRERRSAGQDCHGGCVKTVRTAEPDSPDRKSTRLNSSHVSISYAVFCLKKKNTMKNNNMAIT